MSRKPAWQTDHQINPVTGQPWPGRKPVKPADSYPLGHEPAGAAPATTVDGDGTSSPASRYALWHLRLVQWRMARDAWKNSWYYHTNGGDYTPEEWAHNLTYVKNGGLLKYGGGGHALAPDADPFTPPGASS